MRARRSLALRAIDECILSVVDPHDDCGFIREFSNHSLARSRSARLARDGGGGGGGGGGQGVGIARWRARDAWQRLAAPWYAKVRQTLPLTPSQSGWMDVMK
jgi:hypothetical protein